MKDGKPFVIAMCAIHYGGEYLPEAIKAVEPFVDRIVMLYTAKPSYGHGTNQPCPESEYDLKNIAYSASNKVEWHNISANGEGAHRGLIFRLAEQGGYDGVLTFDADEVWGDLTEWLPKFHESKARNIGITGYKNFWRSFDHICRDGFAPIRYINLHNKDGQENFDATIYHFGCAQRMEIMRYKLLIHGHLPELRKNWIDEVYSSWYEGKETPGGLHLTAWNPPLWQAEKYDKTTLPQILREHFNYPKDVII